MPLVVSRRKDTGTVWITGRVKPAGAKVGVRIRQRAGSNDPELAREEAAAIEARIIRDFHHGVKQTTAATFAEACQSYLTHQERSEGTKAVVRRLVLHWRTTPLDAIDQEAVDAARTKILQPGASDSTWRKTVAILSAVLNHAARRKWCDRASFDLPSASRGRTRFLLPDEYDRLHAAAHDHLQPLLTYLICTGARLGETLALDWSQVDLSGGRVNVWADQTKAGRRRVVMLPPEAVTALAKLPRREGRVFLTPRGEPYPPSDDGGGQIRAAWATACRNAGFPGREVKYARSGRGKIVRRFSKPREHPVQMTTRFVPEIGPHVLRHSWATWHWALNRDLLALRDAGGWSSVTLVERYAHLLPSGHLDAIRRIWEGVEHNLKIVAGRNITMADISRTRGQTGNK